MTLSDIFSRIHELGRETFSADCNFHVMSEKFSP